MTTERVQSVPPAYIDLGKDGSKWAHGYIPENAAAVALKNHKSPGGGSSHDDIEKAAKSRFAPKPLEAPKAPKDGEARTRVTPKTYRGEAGHVIVGHDTKGRKVNVHVPGSLADARLAQARIHNGKGPFESASASDEPSADTLAKYKSDAERLYSKDEWDHPAPGESASDWYKRTKNDAPSDFKGHSAAEQTPPSARMAGRMPGDRVQSEYGNGTVQEHTGRSITVKYDNGDRLNTVVGTPGYDRIKPAKKTHDHSRTAERVKLVDLAVLTTKKRNDLAPSDFALPPSGYPIPDANHARVALALVKRNGSPDDIAKVKAAVKRKFPDIVVS